MCVFNLSKMEHTIAQGDRIIADLHEHVRKHGLFDSNYNFFSWAEASLHVDELSHTYGLEAIAKFCDYLEVIDQELKAFDAAQQKEGHASD